MIEWFFNPWVIICVVVAVVVGNIAALKYTANMKMGQGPKPGSRQHDLDRLNELDQLNQKRNSKHDE